MALCKRPLKTGNNWRGGRRIREDGYVLIFSPDHPHKHKNNYVYEHRLIMEKYIGRVLLPTEIVHHVNGDRTDNRIENMILFSSRKDHVDHHRRLEPKILDRKRDPGGKFKRK